MKTAKKINILAARHQHVNVVTVYTVALFLLSLPACLFVWAWPLTFLHTCSASGSLARSIGASFVLCLPNSPHLSFHSPVSLVLHSRPVLSPFVGAGISKRSGWIGSNSHLS